MRGSIQKKGKVYYAVIPINGKRKWFKGGTKKDAERVLGEKLHEIQGDTYREIRKITFKEYADQWVKSVEAQLKTIYRSGLQTSDRQETQACVRVSPCV